MNHEKTVLLINLPPDRFSAAEMEKVRQAAPGREILYSVDREEITQFLDRIEIVFGFGLWDLYPKMPRLAGSSPGAQELTACLHIRS